jgi:hypothetical protein
MDLFLSSDPELLPVAYAVNLIAQHFVNRDPQPALVDGGVWQDPQTRPGLNVDLIEKERLWAGRVRAAVMTGKLRIYGADGDTIQFHDNTFVFASVKPADLAQWLVDMHRKGVVLDGVRVELTPAPVCAEPERLKRKVLVKRYSDIWPTIDADLHAGYRNGLKAAACLARGYYDVQKALTWAREHGRLREREFRTSPLIPTPLNDLPDQLPRKRINDDWALSDGDDAYYNDP